jgi:hypothetical protein
VDKEVVAFGAARVVDMEELVEACVAVAKEGEEEHEDEGERGAERSQNRRIRKIWRTSYFPQ